MSETRTTMNGKPTFTVPMKTQINFDSGFKKKLLCDGPTFTAGQACAFSCSFCYVDAMQKKAQGYFQKHGVKYDDKGHFGVVIRNANPIERMRQQLLAHPEAERMKKKVIYASPKVDVAANMELVRETVEICKEIIGLTNWDIRLLSKSNLLPKVAQALDGFCSTEDAKERIIYGVSTGTFDDKLAKAFEEGTPLVSKRLESLHWLQDNGYRTYGMICPSLPMAETKDNPEPYFEFSSRAAKALRIEKCEHVWAEAINVRGDSLINTITALRKAGFESEAIELYGVSESPTLWEIYAQATFEAHAKFIPPEKLRFLQYVNNKNYDYWKRAEPNGAVLLMPLKVSKKQLALPL